MRKPLIFALLLLAPPVWAADVTLPEYERVELANGTVLLLSEKHDVPLVGLRAKSSARGVEYAAPSSPAFHTTSPSLARRQ